MTPKNTNKFAAYIPMLLVCFFSGCGGLASCSSSGSVSPPHQSPIVSSEYGRRALAAENTMSNSKNKNSDKDKSKKQYVEMIQALATFKGDEVEKDRFLIRESRIISIMGDPLFTASDGGRRMYRYSLRHQEKECFMSLWFKDGYLDSVGWNRVPGPFFPGAPSQPLNPEKLDPKNAPGK